MAMSPDVKKAWGEWLLANQDKQGKGALRQVTPDGKDEFCCLGGLCELAVQAGVTSRELTPARRDGTRYYGYGPDKEGGLLPREVTEWAGLDSSNPHVTVRCQAWSGNRSLSGLNDDDTTFAEIQALIEEQL